MTELSKTNTIGYDVDYSVLDDFKRRAMARGRQTAKGFLTAGFQEIPESRGESVHLIEGPHMILAFVVEGLGTLGEIAREMLEKTGESYFSQISRANFATIMNDLTACGAKPLVANSFISVGDESWFKDEKVREGVVSGWIDGCHEVGCISGGGETQKLRDIVNPMSAVLGGAAMGIISPKKYWIKGDVSPGDAIIMVESSGIHANGVTMARDVAAALKDGFLTPLPNGQTFGQALLEAPHVLYGPLTQEAQKEYLNIKYVSNITGHGWRKVMRLEQPFTYVIELLPKPQPVFKFIQEHSGASDRKMYETFNMGGGCMYIVPEHQAGAFVNIAVNNGYNARHIGFVEEGPRQVVMPNDMEPFESDEYKVR